MELAIEILVFVGVFWSSSYLVASWNGRGKSRRRYPPSLPSLPLVGSLPFITGFNNIAEFFLKKADQLGPIFAFRASGRLILTLNSRELIDEALLKHSYIFSGRGPVYTERIVNPNAKGLSSMNATKEWKMFHQLSLSILKEFGFGIKRTMETRILIEVQALTDYALKRNGQAFDPREMAMMAAFNVINSIVFGRRHDYELGLTDFAQKTGKSLDSIDTAIDIAPIIRFIPYYRDKLRMFVGSVRRFHEIVTEEVTKSLQQGAEDCYVRRYVEKLGPEYDQEQLRFTIRDLIGGGTDIPAAALLWGLCSLANYPEVQQRLQKEIDAVVPRDRLPSIDDEHNLPFVQATILELMRWKTVAVLALPHLTLSDCKVSGYFIAKGTLVLPNLYAIHMDPKVWKDPDVFRPERFLDERNMLIDENRVVAFSVGRRSCLAEWMARQEIFLLFTGLLQRFFIRPPEGEDFVKVDNIIGASAIPSPFKVRLIPRA